MAKLQENGDGRRILDFQWQLFRTGINKYPAATSAFGKKRT
jgi:hypothetical protein